MKKMLSENLLLKMVSVIGAVILWLLVLNIDNPTDTFTVANIPIRVLNAETALEKQGLTYELPADTTVSVEVTTRRQDRKKVTADDFEATIDMKEIYGPTGSVAVNVTVISNKSLIRSWTQITRSVLVKVEEIQEKELSLEVRQMGNPAESYGYKVDRLQPARITVSAPESVAKQIYSAVVEVDVTDQSDDISQECQILFYDAYGSLISDYGKSKITASAETCQVSLTAEKTNPVNVVVEVTGQLEVAEGYKYITYHCEPQNLVVSGAKTLIAAFDRIQITEDITGLRESYRKSYRVADYLPQGLAPAQGQPEEITVEYQIDALTTREFQIDMEDVEITGREEHLNYELPDSVKVTLIGLADDLDKVRESDIELGLSLEEAKSAGVHFISPEAVLTGSYADYFEIKTEHVMVTVTSLPSEESSEESEES